MQFGLVYDHKYIKNYDTDFVSDAILAFYPEYESNIKKNVTNLIFCETLLLSQDK